MNIREIVDDWLTENNCDGLCGEEGCSCTSADLMPCGDFPCDCVAARVCGGVCETCKPKIKFYCDGRGISGSLILIPTGILNN